MSGLGLGLGPGLGLGLGLANSAALSGEDHGSHDLGEKLLVRLELLLLPGKG